MFARWNPMSLLLVGQGYPPAILFAVVLHGLLLYILLDKKLDSRDMVDLERPVTIMATTVDQNPQRLRRLEQDRQQQARAAEAQRQREAAAREAQARREQEAAAQREREAEAQRQREQQANQQRQREAEAQRQREAEAQRAAQAREAQQAREREAQQQAARQEAARQQAAEQAAADNQSVQAYSAIIHQAVSNNWSRPPSARNDMTVLLTVRLVPTGEVVSVDVVRSSGDAAFDRSALQAVQRAGRFPELQQMPIRLFEREFRSFNLLFRPEDLLR